MTIEPTENSVITLSLSKGDEALLFTGEKPEFIIRPIPADTTTHNPHGVKKDSDK